MAVTCEPQTHLCGPHAPRVPSTPVLGSSCHLHFLHTSAPLWVSSTTLLPREDSGQAGQEDTHRDKMDILSADFLIPPLKGKIQTSMRKSEGVNHRWSIAAQPALVSAVPWCGPLLSEPSSHRGNILHSFCLLLGPTDRQTEALLPDSSSLRRQLPALAGSPPGQPSSTRDAV